MRRVGAIFIGGQGRRLGGIDKSTIEIGGIPLWKIGLEKIRSSVDEVIFIGEEKPEWWPLVSGATFVADYKPDSEQIGPAGALAAGLSYISQWSAPQCLLTSPIDAPFFPVSVLARLKDHLQGQRLVSIAATPERLQPVFGAWSSKTTEYVKAHVDAGCYAMHKLAKLLDAEPLVFREDSRAFFNINTPNDLELAQANWKSWLGG